MNLQEDLDKRSTEIKEMSNKELIWALQTESAWRWEADHDMKKDLATNLYADMELLKYEILSRMSYQPIKKAITVGIPKEGYSNDKIPK